MTKMEDEYNCQVQPSFNDGYKINLKQMTQTLCIAINSRFCK